MRFRETGAEAVPGIARCALSLGPGRPEELWREQSPFLLSPDARWVTGIDLIVDGGFLGGLSGVKGVFPMKQVFIVGAGGFGREGAGFGSVQHPPLRSGLDGGGLC